MQNVCAILILNRPDQAVVENVRHLRPHVGGVIIVDTSTGEDEDIQRARRELQGLGSAFLRSDSHFGEAAALNMGLKASLDRGFEWSLFLDQYSVVPTNYVDRMVAQAEKSARETTGAPFALVLPTYAVPQANQPAGIDDFRPHKDFTVFRTFTSGAMLRTKVAEDIGPFDERLYADYVAHDFYCRLRDRGFGITQCADALLVHNFPESRRLWGSSFRFFTDRKQPFRLYYAFRNRVIMYRRNLFRSFGWVLTDVIDSLVDIGHVVLFREKKGRKLKYIFLGMIDGVLGRTGPVEMIPGESEKAMSYYATVRSEIFPLLPAYSERLVDLGCGSGETAAAIKERGLAGWACGIEINPDAAAKARTRLDRVIEGNIENMELPIEPGSVDTILALDVLEHLVDPWAAVKKLDRCLKPGGVIVASIPNVRHLSLLIPLLFIGDWRYQESGILDSTHLRFFTRKTAIQLMISSGLKLEEVRTTGAGARLGSFTGLFNILTLRKFQGFFDFQYLIRVRKG